MDSKLELRKRYLPEWTDAQFQLYPNPATDMAEVVVQLDGAQEVSMQVFNSVGQRIAERTTSLNGPNRIPIQTSGWQLAFILCL